MSDSPLIPLEELMAKRAGSVDPSKFSDEEFDLYSIPAFDKGCHEVVTGSEIGSTKQVVEPNDVLLSKIVPHIRRSWVVGRNNGRRMIASGEWIVFRSKRADPAYLRHVLIGDPFHAKFMQTVSGVGGSLLRARPAQVAKIKIPLPPLPEQRRIAAILDQADALRAKRREALAQLDSLTQSIFIELFGDPVSNPKGWKRRPLDEISTVGSSKRVFVEELVETGIPFYRGTEVGQLGEGLSVEPSLFISQEHFERLKAETGVPTKGDLLLPSICPDGRIFLVQDEKPFYFKDGRVLWIHLRKSEVNSLFLRQHLKQLFISNYSKIASGTTFAELKIFALKGLGICLPPLEIQEQFANIVEVIQLNTNSFNKQQAELDSLFASFQNRAFRGEL